MLWAAFPFVHPVVERQHIKRRNGQVPKSSSAIGVSAKRSKRATGFALRLPIRRANLGLPLERSIGITRDAPQASSFKAEAKFGKTKLAASQTSR
jgi:hypothetical protein